MAPAIARIHATPSKANASSNQAMGAELQAALARSREEEFKYNYMFGFRKLGDTLSDYRRESKQWTYPQDIEFIVLCYAEEGQSVAHVDIKHNQSSTQHEAKIIGGGIGQNHVRILLTAQNTYWFKYEVRIFGRNNLQEIKE